MKELLEIIDRFNTKATEVGLRRYFDIQYFNIDKLKRNFFLIDVFGKDKYYNIKNNKGQEVNKKDIEIIIENPIVFSKIGLNLDEITIEYSVSKMLFTKDIERIMDTMIIKENEYLKNSLKKINPYFDIEKYEQCEKIGIIATGFYNNIGIREPGILVEISGKICSITQHLNVLIKKDIVFSPKKNIFDIIDI